MNRRIPCAVALTVIVFCWPRVVCGQQQQPSQPPAPGTPAKAATFDDSLLEAGDEELETPDRQLVKWNEYDGKHATFRLGGGFLYEGATYSQDANSREQFTLTPDEKVRDARFVLKGKIKTKRPMSWSTGIMWDVPTRKFLFRETGVMIDVPELFGQIFIGRTKEGFSLNKIMVGYAGWTMERTEISDATIPILADGIKWLGYLPRKRMLWNLGFFGDAVSEGQTFSTYAHQVVGRIAWVPMESEQTGKLLHLGLNLRWGKPDDNQLQNKSRPEAFPAPFFVDTGSFPATATKMAALEAYYRPGPLLLGTEYFVQSVDSPVDGHPFFKGGNAVMSWLATGETRSYSTRGGFFHGVSPARPVFQGGPGAWELVANFSYVDLDSGPVHGGKFWRFTPMVNWHMSDNVRLEFAYGYGSLDRFGLLGATQFFQSRLQLQL
jgi:phosphate-selective porin OprO/OprP